MNRLTKLLAVFMLLLPITVWALDSDSEQAINIEADEALMDDKKGYTEYKGTAILTQGTLKIEGDTITFYFDSEKNLTKAVAIGDLAKFQQLESEQKGLVKARGMRLEFFPKTKTIILIEQAHIMQGGDTFSGPRIKYDTQQNIVYAGRGAASGNTGKPAKTGGRVHVVIQPESSKAKNAPASEPVSEPSVIGDATGLTGFATTRLNVRAEPSVTAVKLGTLPPHGKLAVLNEIGEWLQIQTNVNGEPLIGWVSRQYIKLSN